MVVHSRSKGHRRDVLLNGVEDFDWFISDVRAPGPDSDIDPAVPWAGGA